MCYLLCDESFTNSCSSKINDTSPLKLYVFTENLSALLSDFNLPSLIITLCSLSLSSYPACIRSWRSAPGSHVLRTTFATSSFCVPQHLNHPSTAASFSRQLSTLHTSQADMSVNNNNNHTHMEIQLASKSRMINNTPPQSNNHSRGQCNLYKTSGVVSLLPTDNIGECLLCLTTSISTPVPLIEHSLLQPSVTWFRYATFKIYLPKPRSEMGKSTSFSCLCCQCWSMDMASLA